MIDAGTPGAFLCRPALFFILECLLTVVQPSQLSNVNYLSLTPSMHKQACNLGVQLFLLAFTTTAASDTQCLSRHNQRVVFNKLTGYCSSHYCYLCWTKPVFILFFIT